MLATLLQVVPSKIAETNGEQRNVATKRKREIFANQRMARIAKKPAESVKKQQNQNQNHKNAKTTNGTQRNVKGKERNRDAEQKRFKSIAKKLANFVGKNPKEIRKNQKEGGKEERSF